MYKGLIAQKKGKPLDVVDIKDAVPIRIKNKDNDDNDGLIDVKVLSAGLAFPDLLTIEDKHVLKMKHPFVVGREMAGVIVNVGSNCGDLKVGDMVFGTCYGGIQSEVRIPADQAFKIPKGSNPHLYSGFVTNYGTTWHALVDIGEVKKGEWLLVLGAGGGVGLSACDIGRALGARVIACASSDDKLKICLQEGAEFAVNYSNPETFREQIEKITGGKANEGGGVDVVYDAVGGIHSELAIRMLKFGGRHLVIGFASGGNNPQNGIPKIPLNLILLNERKILGVLYGVWAQMFPDKNKEIIEKMVQMIAEKKLKPLVKVYKLKDWREAFSDMAERRIVGKIVISPNDDDENLSASKL